MTRRSTLTLTTMALLGLAIAAFPQACFAQSDPFLGTWQLNLAKSKYSPGPPPKSRTASLQPEGQNIKDTLVTVNADGNPVSVVTTWIFDGMPRPATGNPNFDAVAYTRVNANTVNESRLRAGQVVQTVTLVVSPDGKTGTLTVTGTNANGRPVNITEVYDKR